MSGLGPLTGHHPLRETLAAAADRSEVPSALLLLGPAGVGKQRLALWLAQRLLCEAPRGPEPCDSCRPCRMTRRLEHPDVHWFFPLPRPKVSGGSDRLGEALEDARAAELESRRAEPYYPSIPNELTGIFLAHVQVIRRLAASRPAMGRHTVFVIGDAESMVPQEASPEAANAVLKLLEEPPPDTTVILTASDGEALLPTIRSRLLTVRVPPLADSEVEQFLVENREVAEHEARRVARLAEGSIGRAMAFLPIDGEPGPLETARIKAFTLLDAVLDGGSRRYSSALEQAPAGARGSFSTVLSMLIVWLRDLAAVAVGAEDAVVNADRIEDLRSRAARVADPARWAASAIPEVEKILQLVTFNINPQLAMGALLGTLTRQRGTEPVTVVKPRARSAR